MFSPNLPDFGALWDYSDPSQTETKFREILLQFPEDDPAFLELLTQIARACLPFLGQAQGGASIVSASI